MKLRRVMFISDLVLLFGKVRKLIICMSKVSRNVIFSKSTNPAPRITHWNFLSIVFVLSEYFLFFKLFRTISTNFVHFPYCSFWLLYYFLLFYYYYQTISAGVVFLLNSFPLLEKPPSPLPCSLDWESQLRFSVLACRGAPPPPPLEPPTDLSLQFYGAWSSAPRPAGLDTLKFSARLARPAGQPAANNVSEMG